mmetsp:Transcript_12595/g.40572  ORF Transcript_12595/g.40572 Transcript_12595/m.40572 type:complete len:294 (+) Transcript_12595:1030-1911(+)
MESAINRADRGVRFPSDCLGSGGTGSTRRLTSHRISAFAGASCEAGPEASPGCCTKTCISPSQCGMERSFSVSWPAVRAPSHMLSPLASFTTQASAMTALIPTSVTSHNSSSSIDNAPPGSKVITARSVYAAALVWRSSVSDISSVFLTISCMGSGSSTAATAPSGTSAADTISSGASVARRKGSSSGRGPAPVSKTKPCGSTVKRWGGRETTGRLGAENGSSGWGRTACCPPSPKMASAEAARALFGIPAAASGAAPPQPGSVPPAKPSPTLEPNGTFALRERDILGGFAVV